MLAKAKLLTTIAGTNRGALASDTDKQAILAAITHLEALNPTPNPMANLDQLEGNWRLLYTTSPQLLGFEQLPLVQVRQIYQCIRSQTLALYNVIELHSAPLLESIIGVTARLTPVSDVRVQVNFERSVFGLKRLLNDQSLDALVTQLASDSILPALTLPFNQQRQPGWLDTTYLDEDLRIGRGNRDSLFVLAKE